MKAVTVCPGCGAQDSLRQTVMMEVEGERSVSFGERDGKRILVYGFTDTDGASVEEVIAEEAIECSRCRHTWNDDTDLLDLGASIEHRCTGCDWWGFNDFNHAHDRPACAGVVYRIDKKPVEAPA